MSEKTPADRLPKSAYGVLSRFRRNLASSGYALRPDVEEQMVISALNRHGKHLHVHQIEQKSIDAFKPVCWFGGYLLELEKESEANCTLIIDAMMKTLRYLLAYESDYWLQMPAQCQDLIKSFLKQERCGNPDHGIWMNGLYLAFHCSLTTWKHGSEVRTPAL